MFFWFCVENVVNQLTPCDLRKEENNNAKEQNMQTRMLWLDRCWAKKLQNPDVTPKEFSAMWHESSSSWMATQGIFDLALSA